jgi:hypothetical protein
LDTAKGGLWQSFVKIQKKFLTFIAAVKLILDGFKDRIQHLITFGKPRVGNKAFTHFFEQNVKTSWRVVNQMDLGDLFLY